MKKYGFCFLLLSIFLFCSCKSKEENRDGLKMYTLKEEGEKLFHLDSLTTQSINYLQVLKNEGPQKLAFYNEPINKICVFDVRSGKEIETILLYNDGPNFIRGVTGFYYDSFDSIWIYRSWEKELILVNHNGVIQEKRKVFENISKESTQYLRPSPYPLTDLPIKKIENSFVLQGMNGPVATGIDLEPRVTVIYNLISSESSYANPYPEIYGKKDLNERWGTFSYRTVPFDVNNKNQMVLSYPADDNVYVYDLKSANSDSFFGGYSKKTNITPVSVGSSRGEFLKHYIESYQYAGVFYDQYNDLYYRLVILPLRDYDLNDEKTQDKNMAIIILNSKFEKVGENIVSFKTPVYRNCFVSPEGFHINVPSEDDDFLKFITFKIEKL